MSKEIRIGFIGLDTSHTGIFSKLIQDSDAEFHVPGGRVVAAYAGGSPDFELSISRVDKFTEQLRTTYDVNILESPEEVAAACDAIMLLSGDGRVHLDQFKRIVTYGKPIYIDKPLAVSYADAQEIFRLAERHHVPVLSSSASRYAEPLQQVLRDHEAESIIGVEAIGPMAIEPTQKGYFWYGIHAIEMLYTVMGTGCAHVFSTPTENHDLITAVWKDGRIGTVRGNRVGNREFGVIIQYGKTNRYVNILSHPKPRHANLMEKVMDMFRHGTSPLFKDETLEIIRFIEAANESRVSGQRVSLDGSPV